MGKPRIAIFGHRDGGFCLARQAVSRPALSLVFSASKMYSTFLQCYPTQLQHLSIVARRPINHTVCHRLSGVTPFKRKRINRHVHAGDWPDPSPAAESMRGQRFRIQRHLRAFVKPQGDLSP